VNYFTVAENAACFVLQLSTDSVIKCRLINYGLSCFGSDASVVPATMSDMRYIFEKFHRTSFADCWGVFQGHWLSLKFFCQNVINLLHLLRVINKLAAHRFKKNFSHRVIYSVLLRAF